MPIILEVGQGLYWRSWTAMVKHIFKGKMVPTYSKLFKMWGIETVDGIQYGDLDTVLSEFCFTGLSFRFHTRRQDEAHWHDHEHWFDLVTRSAAISPVGFSYHDFEADYSMQELAALDQVVKSATVAPNADRWQGFSLPEYVWGAVLDWENYIGRIELTRDYDRVFQEFKSPIKYSRFGHILIIPDPNPSEKWRQRKQVKAFGKKLEIPGEFVLFLHCEDPDAKVLKVSALSDKELVKVIANVTIKNRPADVFDWNSYGNPRYRQHTDPVSLQLRFSTGDGQKHVATNFEAVEASIVQDSEHFSINGFESDYSPQERAYILAILHRYQTVKQPDRWQGFAMPPKLFSVFMSMASETMATTTIDTNYYIGFRQIAAPFQWYRHEHILIIPVPQPGMTIDKKKDLVAFGQQIKVPGDEVYFMHVEDWNASPKMVSALQPEEIEAVFNNVTLNGKVPTRYLKQKIYPLHES